MMPQIGQPDPSHDDFEELKKLREEKKQLLDALNRILSDADKDAENRVEAALAYVVKEKLD